MNQSPPLHTWSSEQFLPKRRNPIFEDGYAKDLDQDVQDLTWSDEVDEENPNVHGGSRPGKDGNPELQHAESYTGHFS